MTISMYQASVPVLLQGLKALSSILAKVEANAAERKIDPQVFLSARLAPHSAGFEQRCTGSCNRWCWR